MIYIGCRSLTGPKATIGVIALGKLSSVWKRIVKVALMPDEVMGIQRAEEGVLQGHGGIVRADVRYASSVEGGLGNAE